MRLRQHDATPGGTVKVTSPLLALIPLHVTLLGLKFTGIAGFSAVSRLATPVLVFNQPSQLSRKHHLPRRSALFAALLAAKPKDGAIYTVPRSAGDRQS